MKGIVAVLAAGMLFAGAAPALAGGNLTLKPNPVKQGKRLSIIASNCVSGAGYTARVVLRIVQAGDNDIFKKVTRRADDSGTTKIRIKMKPRKWLPDRYGVGAQCVHEFDNGDSQVFWEECCKVFRVKPARI